MIHGAHFLLYTDHPDADRAFLRDVIGLKGIDIGHGWIIMALPPSEIAVHPAETPLVQGDAGLLGAHLYLMCDDVKAEIARLQAKGAACTAIDEARWGLKTTVKLPSGGCIGLYQPLHPTALGLK